MGCYRHSRQGRTKPLLRFVSSDGKQATLFRHTDYGKTRDAISFFSFVQDRRSLMVASSWSALTPGYTIPGFAIPESICFASVGATSTRGFPLPDALATFRRKSEFLVQE